MPKRRMTAARILQIKKFQLAGSKANSRIRPWSAAELKAPRKLPRSIDTAKYLGHTAIPTGKNTLLYHRTDDWSASKIVKTRKWVSGTTSFSGIRGRSWFSRGGPVGRTAFYGPALLTVKVPRRQVRFQPPQIGGLDYVSVANKDLAGRKVTRHS